MRLLTGTCGPIDVAAILTSTIAGGRATLSARVASLVELGLSRAVSRAEAVAHGRRPIDQAEGWLTTRPAISTEHPSDSRKIAIDSAVRLSDLP